MTLSDGNLNIGTAGKGIDFSAAANQGGATSELLDDYEEGSFTPALLNDGSTTYSKQKGKYTKIGNMVWFNIEIHINNEDSSATSTTGVAVPFNNNTDSQVSARLVGNNGWDLSGLNTENLAGWMSNNDNNMYFYKNSGSNLNGISVNDIGSNGEVVVEFFMRTNSG